MWIFYSNLILQENTADAKISVKTRRDQPTRRIEVVTENRSRDRKLSCQSFQSRDITKINFEEEIEEYNKRSCDLKKEVATKEVWSRLKEIFKRRIFMSGHHSDVAMPMEYN